MEKAEYTTRLQVPGGWLYKYEYPWMEHSSSMAFVPDLRNAPTMPPAEDYHHSGVPGDRA